jgi:hypothetical protein
MKNCKANITNKKPLTLQRLAERMGTKKVQHKYTKQSKQKNNTQVNYQTKLKPHF